LKLTKRELKKLRTQRRQAREAEKQDLIRCEESRVWDLLVCFEDADVSHGWELTRGGYLGKSISWDAPFLMQIIFI